VTAAEVPVEAGTEAPAAVSGEQTVTVVVQDTIETFTETLASAAAPGETADMEPGPEAGTEDASATPEMQAASVDASPAADEGTTEVVQSDPEVEPAPAEATLPQEEVSPDPAESTLEATQPTAAVTSGDEDVPAAASTEATPESTAEMQTAEAPVAAAAEAALTQEESPLDNPEHVAYEEFLKDTNEPVHIYEPDPDQEQEVPGPQEPIAKIDPSGELQIEMDTKNAHVWNELGNVYFNTSAFDDAIIAYSKAIELDRWFAWPYSNLALAYVQKRRFVEAILLYQRSIELFTGEKDKAISWNRLGNVYRRLNDYENAIAAYQRADELDPENTTLSLQSRFSLLGSYALEQKPSYVS
jgi:tetratricopeptide (TPR) repeat protein